MNFLINASNIRGGGGLQVTDSICGLLYKYPQHRFVVVLSSAFSKTEERIKHYQNVSVLRYGINRSIITMLTSRNRTLDRIVHKESIDAVLTVFGPCGGWRPKVPHLCGYARPQLILTQSPYYQEFTFKDKIGLRLLKHLFCRCSSIFYTENKLISEKVENVFQHSKVFTVTNYYNQIFDIPDKWIARQLPLFDGCTLLTISTANPHKNYSIIPKIAIVLKEKFPGFKFRFVLTINKNDLPEAQQFHDGEIIFLGGVDIAECPSLYEQCDIMFMPTLMECFSATYPEAMRMGKPIVTTDLDFARGLCDNAACYYSAMDEAAAADAIYQVATDKKYATELVENGKKQLCSFDNYEQRAYKLIHILENIAKKCYS